MPRPPRDRPFVLVNMAMTADGKIATANRAVNTFGSPRDQRHLYALRATADAILCGADTVNAPGVTLDAGGPRFERLRSRRGLAPQPLAVIVSGRGRVRPDAGVFTRRPRDLHNAPVVLVSNAAPADSLAALTAAGGEIRVFDAGKTMNTVDLASALAWLHRERGVHRLVAEGGAALNGALVEADLVDEWHVTLCPVLAGGRHAPTVAGGHGLPRLADAPRFLPPDIRRSGDELFLVFRRS